ncbi:OmpP1/FadL family transporter [Marinilabilia rubra]|uniref:Hydrocarbon degradation protein n=1 Tax=Marinilabilia rubra TaxID=2162893 RepID=A0A2U2BC64_9BACT|nr:outer membrane protein transport protein [Marinilabilia rubra]PWE00658.1 hydrocarbon degradation protein [Marinilabilia rubra]
MKYLLLTVLCAFFTLHQGFAEGYQVNLQGQKQTGMGHTGTGLLLGPSSIHFNPGALSFLEGDVMFSGGVSGVISQNSFLKEQPSLYTGETDNPVGTPFSVYGAFRLSEKLMLGLGANSPYGNSLSWGEDWDGRYLIQDISLQAIFVQPTISYAITPRISIGGGPVLAFGSVDLNKALPLQSDEGDGSVNLNGSTTAYGYNVGVFVKVSKDVSLGVNYRSKVVMELDGGDATFDVPESFQTNFPDGNTFSAELPMPSNLTIGLGWKATDKLLLALDLQQVGWSEYQELNFDFEENTAALEDSENPRNFENTMVYRVGAEYSALEQLKLRAGIYYDETPIPSDYLTPETPGTNKIGISAGVSWQLNDKLSLDASLLHISGEERKDGYAPLNYYGTYNSSAWIPGFGVSWTL